MPERRTFHESRSNARGVQCFRRRVKVTLAPSPHVIWTLLRAPT